MSSLRPQDRKSLCRFTFADGRQCRTPAPPTSPQPAPSPHTPLPRTSNEFIQHVMAGRNLSRSGRETGGKSSLP